MVSKTLSQFDPSPYLVLPRMPLTELLTLIDVLRTVAPEGPWPAVKVTADRLGDAAEQAKEVMVERIRSGGRFTREDVSFDIFVDGIWGLFRDRLAGWSRYKSDGRVRLTEDQELEIDLEELEERAERAAAIVERLFADGLELLRRPYNEQAQLMSNLLSVIEAEELESDLLELTGDELLPVLRACQRRYEVMVKDRLAQPKNTTIGDLNEQRSILQRHVYFYTNAVINTLSQPEPNTVESVEAALLPIINVRLGRSALIGRRADSADTASSDEAEVQPLEAAQDLADQA